MPIQMLQDNSMPQRALDLGLRGTSFPANPLTNDRFYRSDRRFWYFYDGTRWVTEELFQATAVSRSAQPFADTTTVFFDASILNNVYGYSSWLESSTIFFQNTTAQSNTVFWSIGFVGYFGVTSSAGLAATSNTKAFTAANTIHEVQVTHNATLASNYYMLQCQFAPTASPNNPGAFFCTVITTYRLIG